MITVTNYFEWSFRLQNQYLVITGNTITYGEQKTLHQVLLHDFAIRVQEKRKAEHIINCEKCHVQLCPICIPDMSYKINLEL